MEQKKVILSIAGSDSGAGAGIQADIKAAAALGGFVCTAITSVTAQNTLGVQKVSNLPIDLVMAQIHSVFSDFQVGAIKIGMLGRGELAQALGLFLKKLDSKKFSRPVILDPVFVATSGDKLGANDLCSEMIDGLFPHVTLVTPNLYEAEALTEMKIQSLEDIQSACQRIASLGPQWVLIKGGDNQNSDQALDVLFSKESKEFFYFEGPKSSSKNTHGTGCSLSTAIAANLVKCSGIPWAVESAKEYVFRAIVAGEEKNFGSGQGPIHHFWAAKD